MLCALLLSCLPEIAAHTQSSYPTVAHLEMSHRGDSHTSLSALTAEASTMCQTIYKPRFTAQATYSPWVCLDNYPSSYIPPRRVRPRRIPLGGSAGHFQLISLPVASGGILLCTSTEAADSDVRLSNSVFEVLVGFRPTRSV